MKSSKKESRIENLLDKKKMDRDEKCSKYWLKNLMKKPKEKISK